MSHPITPGTSEPAAIAWRRLALAPLLILLGGALLTLLLYLDFRQREAHRAANQAHGEFTLAARERIHAIERGIDNALDETRDLWALFRADPAVDRGSFTTFARTRTATPSSIRALGWVPRVPAAERERFERRARNTYPHFRITQRGRGGSLASALPRAEYFPVYFVEPYTGNEAALGLDLASEPAPHSVLEWARDHDRLAVTGRMTPIQGSADQSGILAMRPVYRRGVAIETVEERRRHLEGIVLGVIDVRELVESSLAPLRSLGIDIWLYDESAAGPAGLLYAHGANPNEPAPLTRPPPTTGLRQVSRIDVGGRQWRIHAAAAPGAFIPAVSTLPSTVLLIGLSLSTLLTLYGLSLRRHTVRLEQVRDTLAAEVAEHHRTYRSLEEAQRIAHLGSWELDLVSNTLHWSKQVYRIFEIDPDRFGASYEAFLDTVHPDDREFVNRAYGDSVANRTPYDIEHRLLMSDGRIKYVNERCETFYAGDGTPLRSIGTVLDITGQREAEATRRLLTRAVEASCNGIMIADARRPGLPIQYVNPAFTDITGYAPEESIGQLPTFLQGEDREQPALESLRHALRHHQAGSAELRNYRKDGALFWNDLHIAPVEDEAGELTHYVGIINDITERKRYEEQLEYEASHDTLTGLANRHLLMDRLHQAIAHCRRYGRQLAVLFVDLDQLKLINDGLGHSVGDDVIGAVARRLNRSARQGDTVARLGGDEFVMLLSEVPDAESVSEVAGRLLEQIARPLTVRGQELRLTASVGVSTYPRNGEDAEALLKNADAAMYRAKERGRNNFQFYTEELNAQVMERLTLEGYLRRALEHNELLLYYQPQVDLHSGRIVGMEALLRWRHPERGMVPPAQFIPLAEQNGLILPIGAWVLDAACRQGQAWRDEGLPEITLSVNLSAHQLRQENLDEMIAAALERSGLAPQRLDLELTESVLMEDPAAMFERLGTLKAMGLRLSIDDFGTGYSSLAYLQRFPFDALKIDRSFVHRITEEPKLAAIALAILSLARGLELKVVAEGVETPEQLSYLRHQGCDAIQGYYFSPPLPADGATQLMRTGKRLAECNGGSQR